MQERIREEEIRRNIKRRLEPMICGLPREQRVEEELRNICIVLEDLVVALDNTNQRLDNIEYNHARGV